MQTLHSRVKNVLCRFTVIRFIFHILYYIRFKDTAGLYYVKAIENYEKTIQKNTRGTVWDRVPKEDAANFESDTFL